MATNFPTSLDTFTNPNSGNTLDSPSHSIQHSDINDAVEAIEAKLGVGSSTAGSATAGYALVNTSGGTTAYSLLGVSGLSSGTAVANTVLTANGSGAATFASLPIAGLRLLTPSSVTVGSGSGSVSATGTVDFSGASSVSILGVFSATYNRYRIHLYAQSSVGSETSLRFLDGSTPHTTGNYRKQQIYAQSTTVASVRTTNATSWALGVVPNGYEQYLECNLINPFQTVRPSGWINDVQDINGNITWSSYAVSCDATTAFTGFQIFPGSGTITGKVSTYAWND